MKTKCGFDTAENLGLGSYPVLTSEQLVASTRALNAALNPTGIGMKRAGKIVGGKYIPTEENKGEAETK